MTNQFQDGQLLYATQLSALVPSPAGTLTPAPSLDDVPSLSNGDAWNAQGQALLNRTQYLAQQGNTISAAAAANGQDLIASFFLNSDSSLYLFASSDGVNFTPLHSLPLYTLTGRALRDPSIMFRDGWWWCAYSNVPSNSDFDTTYFGVAKSQDLTNWQHAFDINTGTNDTWAPEWFVDASGNVFVVVSINTQTFLLPIDLGAGTAGSPINLNIPGDSIDGTIVWDGTSYFLFVKNDTTKYIERYQAASASGPWTQTGAGDWAGWGANIEGPSVFQQPDGTWRIFFDGYNVDEYFTSTAPTLGSNTWSAPVPISQSGNVRHGTVIRLTDVARRVDSLAAARGYGAAGFVLSGPQKKTAEVVSANSVAPLNGVWQQFRTDSDAAVYQARKTGDASGFDAVARRELGYFSHEYVAADGITITPIVRFWDPSKSCMVEFPSGILTEAWKTPTFENGWAAGSVACQYKSNSEGLVKIEGIVAGGTATKGTAIFNLPEGWRPERTVVFPVVDNDVGVGTVGVTTSGDVVILSGSNTKLDLSNISFYRT